MTARFGTYTVNHQIVKPFLSSARVTGSLHNSDLSCATPQTPIFPCALFLYVEPPKRSSHVVSLEAISKVFLVSALDYRDVNRVDLFDGSIVRSVGARHVRDLLDDLQSVGYLA